AASGLFRRRARFWVISRCLNWSPIWRSAIRIIRRSISRRAAAFTKSARTSQGFHRLSPASRRCSFKTSTERAVQAQIRSADDSAPQTLPRRRATWRHLTAHGGMFDSFRKFLSEASEGGEHPIRFEHNDYRLAAAALLVHAAAIDGDVSDAERD